MTDVVLLGAVAAFFAVADLYLRWCDHLVGPDEVVSPEPRGSAESAATERLRAGDPR